MSAEIAQKRAISVTAGLSALLAGLALAQVVLLATTLRDAAGGAGVPPDFVLVWAAGAAARAGEAAAFYDPGIAKAFEVAAIGRDFTGVYRWVYPPTLFLLAAPLAGLPYGFAQAVFTAASFAGFAAVLGRLAGWPGLLVSLAWPASLACAIVGQNGFLIAALLGAGVLVADRRPLLAGICFGLISFKPHLGLLLPVALVASGQWRAIVATAATALGFAASSALVLGLEPWFAFLRSIPQSGDGLLGAGIMGFGKLQTVFGAARFLGLPAPAAGPLQAAVALAAGTFVWFAWRRRVALPADLRLAVLAVATALASPYLYVYDLPLVALAAAIVARHRPERVEAVAIALAAVLIFVQAVTGAPFGLASTLVVAVLVFRRTLLAARRTAQWDDSRRADS